MKKVFVIGNGMTKFIRPGREENPDYPQLAAQAIKRAMNDAAVSFNQCACFGYVYGDSTSGQRALMEIGLSGIPVYNVNNNCATGSTALQMAHSFISGGLYDCVLACGFEKMEKGSLGTQYGDRANPLDKIINETIRISQNSSKLFAPMIFGNAGIEHMKKYGTKPEHFAKISQKNHKHSANNPYSQFKDVYTLEQILKSPQIHGPLTKLQCCPTSDGQLIFFAIIQLYYIIRSAAAIICSENFVKTHNLQNQAVEIVGIVLKTDFSTTYSENSLMNLAGYDMAKRAIQELYQKTNVDPQQISVVELHDCFSANELITYEALQLCPEGKAGEFIDKDYFTYGGKYVVNPSGGLISKGHPLGATGLAQCAELCWQLRNMAGKRQVLGAEKTYALQHNLGLGGAVVVALYKRYQVDKPLGTTREQQTSDPDELEKMERKQNIPKL